MKLAIKNMDTFRQIVTNWKTCLAFHPELENSGLEFKSQKTQQGSIYVLDSPHVQISLTPSDIATCMEVIFPSKEHKLEELELAIMTIARFGHDLQFRHHPEGLKAHVGIRSLPVNQNNVAETIIKLAQQLH